MKSLRKIAEDYGVPIIRTESHQFLTSLVKKMNPMHIFEIGTAIGYSGIEMLNSCDADLTTIEHNHEYVKLAKNNFKKHKLYKRVNLIEGDCLVELAKIVANPSYNEYFDFIFLDGPKAQYNLILDLIILLLAPGGTLVADNVLFHGYLNNANVPSRHKTIVKRLEEFVKKCKNSPKLVNFKLKSIEDGILIAQKVKNEK